LVLAVPPTPGVVVLGVEVVFAAVPAPGVVVEPVVPSTVPPLVVGVVEGVVAVVGVAAVVGVDAAAGVVTVVVVAGTGAEPPARSTKAAASTPRASTTTTANTPIGCFQPGAGARRVRAAAPQLKHHDCSGCRGAPHTGHASPLGAGDGVPAGMPPWGGCEVAALTSPAGAGG